MTKYVGPDVSLEETAVCVVDELGRIVAERKVVSRSETIATFLRAKAPDAERSDWKPGRRRYGCGMNCGRLVCRSSVSMPDTPRRGCR